MSGKKLLDAAETAEFVDMPSPPLATPSDTPSWMTGMYTVDMVEGLL
jgi:hypothetical protein